MNKPFDNPALASAWVPAGAAGQRQHLAEATVLTDGSTLAVWALMSAEGDVVQSLQAQRLNAVGVALSAGLPLPTGTLQQAAQAQIGRAHV